MYATIGHWALQAVLGVPNIHALKVKIIYSSVILAFTDQTVQCNNTRRQQHDFQPSENFNADNVTPLVSHQTGLLEITYTDT